MASSKRLATRLRSRRRGEPAVAEGDDALVGDTATSALSFDLRRAGVNIKLLRALEGLAEGINPSSDYWTVERVGALLVGNHEILDANNRWGVVEDAARRATLTYGDQCSLIELLRTRYSEEPHPLLQLTYGQCVAHQANVYVSCAYLQKFRDVIAVAEGYLRKLGPGAVEESTTYFWLDLLVNDHWTTTTTTTTTTFSADTLISTIKQIGTVLMVMSPWDKPVVLTRAWCIFELYVCVSTGSRFEVGFPCLFRFLRDICFYPERFSKMLDGISPAAEATASHTADRDAIFEAIEQSIGFSDIDSIVRRTLQEWLERELRMNISEVEAEREAVKWKCVLGWILIHDGKHAEARLLWEECLDIYRRISGPDDPDTLDAMGNLASLYENQGEQTRALLLYEKCLVVERRIRGKDHVSTLPTITKLADLYMDQGEYTKAQPLLEQSLEMQSTMLGRDHPDTLKSIGRVGTTYKKQGKYIRAQELLKECLARRTMVLGRAHPDTLTTIDHLGLLYKNQGEFAKALRLYKEGLDTRTRVLGRDHPETLLSLFNLGQLYESQGVNTKALQLEEECLDLRTRVLGRGHPDTLASVDSLGVLYYRLKEYSKALPMFKECFSAREKALGPSHPDTVKSKNYLAACRGRA